MSAITEQMALSRAAMGEQVPEIVVRCIRRLTVSGSSETQTEPFDAMIGQRRQTPLYSLEGVAPGDVVTLMVQWDKLLSDGRFSPVPFFKNDEIDVIRGPAAPVRHQVADVSFDPTETICTLTCVRVYAE